ncbi:predicted protein [Chaetoceros tenuissimus]|uniref:Uncharacterized protein n=1 Tax=Chaetoceros tenuissimus TaxID=426638 RepID=A0AAD3CXZ3_9STRA|nr:predicted protein [Chaetoceros tenuissimus]
MSSSSDPKIIRHIKSRRWIALSKRMKTPKGQNELTVFASSLGRNCVHIALENDAPTKIIQEMLEILPNATSYSDCFGLRPLHTACCCISSSPSNVIAIMEHDNGMSLRKKDKKRNNPLHHVAKSILDPLHYLRYSKRIKGALTWGSICSGLSEETHLAHIQVLKYLASHSPRLLHKKDSRGCTVMEILQDSTLLWAELAYSGLLEIDIACNYAHGDPRKKEKEAILESLNQELSRKLSFHRLCNEADGKSRFWSFMQKIFFMRKRKNKEPDGCAEEDITACLLDNLTADHQKVLKHGSLYA